MHRRLLVWVQVVLSGLAATLVCWPFAGFWWCVFITVPAGGKAGPPAVAISTPVNRLLQGLTERTWPYSMAIGETVIGGALGIGIFLLIHRWASPAQRPETRCRRCGIRLTGLASPQCPACGERL